MKSGIKKTILFCVYVVVLNVLFAGVQWLNSRYSGTTATILLFPLKMGMGAGILAGFAISYYVIWAIPPRAVFEKIIIWFMRIATVFLSAMIVFQIGVLLHDHAPFSDEGWSLVRYNLFHDIGWQATAWYLSMRFAQGAVKT